MKLTKHEGSLSKSNELRYLTGCIFCTHSLFRNTVLIIMLASHVRGWIATSHLASLCRKSFIAPACFSTLTNHHQEQLKLCVVGSGPAGLYTLDRVSDCAHPQPFKKSRTFNRTHPPDISILYYLAAAAEDIWQPCPRRCFGEGFIVM